MSETLDLTDTLPIEEKPTLALEMEDPTPAAPPCLPCSPTLTETSGMLDTLDKADLDEVQLPSELIDELIADLDKDRKRVEPSLEHCFEPQRLRLLARGNFLYFL